MACCGADIAVNYNSHGDEADEVAEEVRGLGRRAAVFQGDVSKRTAVNAMVAGAVEELGRLDIAVCNAYYSKRQPFLELSEEAIMQLATGGKPAESAHAE